MSDFVLSCCSTSDLTPEFMKEYELEYLSFHYELADKTYLDDLGQSLNYDEFYSAMADGAMTRTSQPNVSDYKTYFKKFLDEGKDILHLSLSSGISGAVNSATVAASELSDEYPDRKIYVEDSLAASGGFGLLMITLSDMKKAGADIEELYTFTKEHKLELNHWFFTSDLTYLIRGGRVSKAAGFFGQALSVCPLLNVDYMGRLISRYKIRTKKKVILATVDKCMELINDGENYTGKIMITHANCFDDAKSVGDMLEERLPKMDGKVIYNFIGPTIGAHTGPGTVALFFWGAKRVD